MSKQSNQRYRKEMEKKNAPKKNQDTSCTNKTSAQENQANKFDYGDGDFDAPSNSEK